MIMMMIVVVIMVIVIMVMSVFVMTMLFERDFFAASHVQGAGRRCFR